MENKSNDEKKGPNGSRRTEHYERREIPHDHPDAGKFSYKTELPLTPDELALLGKEDGYLRFVRFSKEKPGGEEQMIVVDARIGQDFAYDMARAIRGKKEVIELFAEALKLAEALDGPLGKLIEITFDAKRAMIREARSHGGKSADICPCEKCTNRRAAEAVAATGNPDQVDPLQN